jgi:hypothetical protein
MNSSTLWGSIARTLGYKSAEGGGRKNAEAAFPFDFPPKLYTVRRRRKGETTFSSYFV